MFRALKPNLLHCLRSALQAELWSLSDNFEDYSLSNYITNNINDFLNKNMIYTIK